MNGLDLFSGIGGLTKALEGYVTPVAYCENDRYCHAVLVSRMADGSLPFAPIWDDVRTLKGVDLPTIDIIYGGFPCQDISVAGRGAGLEGERSGLFFEIARLVGEIRPGFVFLENVSALTVRGAERVVGELCRLRYDCRWGLLSASDVGANHQRERWWLLAHTNDGTGSGQSGQQQEVGAKVPGICRAVRKPVLENSVRDRRREIGSRESARSSEVADTKGPVSQGKRTKQEGKPRGFANGGKALADPGHSGMLWRSRKSDTAERERSSDQTQGCGWWSTEPDVGRVAHGVQFRVDRLRGLGNAVVPAQAREAFERLMGLK